MPIQDQEIRIDLMLGANGCSVILSVSADALRRLGLHPSQPSSKIVGLTPWWNH